MVEWQDACAASRWTSPNETTFALSSIVSSGFVVAKEKDRVTLVGDLDRSAGNVSRIVSIPLGGINKVRVLLKKCIEPGFFLLSEAERAAVRAAKRG